MIQHILAPSMNLRPETDYAIQRIFKKMNHCRNFHNHVYIFLMPENIHDVFSDYKYEYRINPQQTCLFSKSVFYTMYDQLESFAEKTPAHEKIIVRYPTWATAEDIFLALKSVFIQLVKTNRTWLE